MTHLPFLDHALFLFIIMSLFWSQKASCELFCVFSKPVARCWISKHGIIVWCGLNRVRSDEGYKLAPLALEMSERCLFTETAHRMGGGLNDNVLLLWGSVPAPAPMSHAVSYLLSRWKEGSVEDGPVKCISMSAICCCCHRASAGFTFVWVLGRCVIRNGIYFWWHTNPLCLCLQASHFFWGLWALIQAKVSTIDFDFLG